MKAFLIKTFLFVFICFAGLLILGLSRKPPVNDYMAAIIDKHAKADAIKVPKIIFAGGSNLAFGLNSEEIQQRFGVPVINLGLHKDLGLVFILNEVKDVARRNDIVFLSLEYYMPVDGNYKLEELTSNFYPRCEKYYSRKYLKDLNYFFDQEHKDFKSLFSDDEVGQHADPVYARNTFNKFGDHISHLALKRHKNLDPDPAFIDESWKGIKEMNKLYTYSKAKGFSVYFLFPPFAKSRFEKDYLPIKKFQQDLDKNSKIEVLDRPGDMAFSDSLFFDTEYHLNRQGREQRTQKLIQIFEKNTDIQDAFLTAKENAVLNVSDKK